MVFLLIVLFVLGGVLWAISKEKQSWNNGICGKCGKKWIYFDTDSQGGRGYKDKNDHTIWISYPKIDR